MQQTIPTPAPTEIASVNLAPAEPTMAGDDLFGEVQTNVKAPQPSVDSIESMWNSLTGPVIKLDLDEPADSEARRELAAAARTILAASAPGADPFTQGWLTNAAKAILKAAAVEGKKEELTLAEAMEEPIAQFTAQQQAERKPRAPELPAAADPVRPAWIDNPDSREPNSLSMVVSTDQLNTVEECKDQLAKRLRYAVAERVRELAVQATGRSPVGSPMLADMGITPEYIARELCPKPAFIETVDGSAGQMKRAHALLEFTPQKDQALLRRWQLATGNHKGPVQAELAATEAAPRPSIYTEGERPAWVDSPPTRVGNTQRVVVTTDPYSTAEECVPDLHAKLLSAVRSRVGELAQAAAGGNYVQVVDLAWLDISPEYILAELCPQGVYVETLKMSVGPMKRAHALLEFSDAQDQILLAKWKSYARRESMAVVAVMAACVGGGLSLVYGLLKLDTWTRGYYSKRLFIGVPAAIIAAGMMFSVLVALIG